MTPFSLIGLGRQASLCLLDPYDAASLSTFCSPRTGAELEQAHRSQLSKWRRRRPGLTHQIHLALHVDMYWLTLKARSDIRKP
ncbi:hypothetical protein AA103193_2605 [Tanticharoenia sakaeratensis NBRC 103193]|nr:hypothetical protein AA103193_2605 [Tanticharoenia sakaeratensis NBRC 103193]